MCFETKPPPLKHLTYKNMDDKNDAVYLWKILNIILIRKKQLQ